MKPRPIIELLAYRRNCAECGAHVDVDYDPHPIWDDDLEAELWFCPECCPECNEQVGA